MGQGSLSQFIIVNFIRNMFKVKGDRFFRQIGIKKFNGSISNHTTSILKLLKRNEKKSSPILEFHVPLYQCLQFTKFAGFVVFVIVW